MDIILSILQIIGIVLLIVLAIALVLVLLLLFWPVGYIISGKVHENTYVDGKFAWFLHLIRGKFIYEDDLLYGEIGILWKKIQFSKEFVREDVEDEDAEDEVDPFAQAIQEALSSTEADENDISDVNSEESELDGTSFKESSTKGTEQTTDKKHSNRKKESLNQKIDRIICKIKAKIKFIKKKIKQIKTLITDEKNQQAVIHLKNELFYLIKILLPKKSKVEGVFSTGSPDTTGQAFGLIACIPAIYENAWKITPDFHGDKAYFEGDFWGKGRIYVYQLLGIIIRVVFDKNCRRLNYIIKRLGEQKNAGK